MFLKTVRSSQGIQYVYVVDGYRDEQGNVRHKYLFSLGRLEDFLNSPSFKKLAQLALGTSSDKAELALSVSEGEMMRYGHMVLKKLWDKFKLDEFFALLKGDRKTKFNIAEAVFYMAGRHIIESDSKLGMYESRGKYINLESLGINHLYRALDILSDNKDGIERYLFEQNKNLFNMKVDIVFYDVTTVYFESTNEDILRKYGFSKDGKFNTVQIVLGLIVDKEGRPIGYDIFSGNTFDGKTLKPFLQRLKERFSIDKVIVVADRGINSKLNLWSIKELGYGYIVATRLRGMGREVLEEVFKEEGYKELADTSDVFRYKTIPYINKIKDGSGSTYEVDEQLIVSYSSNRAKKDAKDRERLIDKAIEMLNKPSSISAANKRGGRKYLSADCRSKLNWQLDTEQITEDERFDGYYAIQTSEKWMNAEEVMEAYHNLWKIEESFRVMKTTLEVRPVFHWTEKRIRGHFVVCFIAFLMMRTMEGMLRRDDKLHDKVSPRIIKEALREMTVTKVRIQNREYYLKNKLTQFQTAMIKKVKAKMPENLTPIEDFSI